MEEKKTPKRPMIYYYIVVIIVILLLNALIVPFFEQQRVEDVDYNTFLDAIENNAVDEVHLTDTTISFTRSGEDNIVYETGRMEDPSLVERLYEANATFNQEITTETSPLLSFLIFWILPIIIFIIIGQYLMRKMQKGTGAGGNVMTIGKNKSKIYIESETGVSFDDVAGQDEAKMALQEIIEFLHDPKKFTDIGAELPKGALLVGPPGTGKTLIAKAVAGEAKVPFFTISGSEFVEMFVGVGAARVRDLFKQAQEKAPCIVFIDEIDAIGKSRDNSGMQSNDEREQTLNQLLSEMDGFDGKKGVVILAATNRPEVLDKALLRPGRFDRRIPLELPDLNGREAIIKVHARKLETVDDIDYRAIARATPGTSGAELKNIANEAAIRAVKHGRTKVTQEDFEASVENVIAGYERKTAVISPQEKKVIAYHEVGHAIVAAKQKGAAPVTKITIIPRTSGALGFTMQVHEEEKVLYSREELFNQITTLTGGRAAEDIVFGTGTTGAANDIERATKLARSMITRYGMSDTFGMMGLETVVNPYLGGDTSMQASAESAAKVDAEVSQVIEEAYTKATNILDEHKDKLHEISAYLYEVETISGEQFMELLEGEEIETIEPIED